QEVVSMRRSLMSVPSFLAKLLRGGRRRKQAPVRKPMRSWLALEALEDRQLLSTLTVTSAADDGPGTLRQTIAVARNGDTIQFSPDLNGQTISLTSGELPITKSLNIQGPDASKLGITSSARVFDITTPGADVTISGLGLKGSGVSMGGAILNQGGHLTVADANLSGMVLFGSSPSGSAKGGAIASTGAGASLTVLNSTFLGDSVHGAAGNTTNPNGGDGIGGAIFGDVNTTLSVTGCTFGFTFLFDSAAGGSGFGNGHGGNGQGGAIGFLGTSLSVVASTFGDSVA